MTKIAWFPIVVTWSLQSSRNAEIHLSRMLNLVIKSPNHTIADFPLSVPAEWSIAELKAHLAIHYPGAPPIISQRIIYSGKLLVDSQSVSSSVNSKSSASGSTFTLHLVISLNKNRLSTSASLSQICGEVVDTSNSNPNDETRRGIGNIHSASTSALLSGAAPGALNLPEHEVRRYQQEYENYLRSYYYHSLWHGLYSSQSMYPGTAAWGPSNGETSLRQRVPLATTVEEPAAAAVEAAAGVAGDGAGAAAVAADVVGPAPGLNEAARPVAGNNMAPGAAFGGFLDAADDGAGAEAAENRDPMDIFYGLLRLALLGALVYYYSTPEKAILSLLLLGLIYVLQGNFFRAYLTRLWPGERAPEGPPEAPQASLTPPSEGGDQQNTVASPEGIEVVPAESPSYFERFLWVRVALVTSLRIVVTFFTSLIPERPPAIDVN